MTQPDPDLAGAGLSATGKTADQFEPGDDAPGSTYGSPSGTGGEAVEAPGGDVAPGGESADGDVEGG
jgi:hypothetical protein